MCLLPRAGPAFWENSSWPSQPKSRYGNARSSYGSRQANPKDAKTSTGTKRRGNCRTQKTVVTQTKVPTFNSVVALPCTTPVLARRASGVSQAAACSDCCAVTRTCTRRISSPPPRLAQMSELSHSRRFGRQSNTFEPTPDKRTFVEQRRVNGRVHNALSSTRASLDDLPY